MPRSLTDNPHHLERDACGSASSPARRASASREVLDARARGAHAGAAPGAVAADHRTGDGAGVLLPLPRALAPRAWGSRWCSRATRAARAAVEEACVAEGIRVRSLARACRSTRTRSGPRPAPARRASSRRCSRRCPASDPELRAFRARRRLDGRDRRLRRLALVPDRRLQGALRRRPARRLLPRPARPGARGRRSASSTSASRPTRRRRGSARSRSGCSATTARSTRSAATSTGCAPAPGALGWDARARPAAARRDELRLRDARQRARAARPRRPRRARTRCRCSSRRRGRATRSSPDDVRSFYRFHAGLVEPWDGPAGHRVLATAAPSAPRSTATGCGRCASGVARATSCAAARRRGSFDLPDGAGPARPARARARCSSSIPSAACRWTARSSATSPRGAVRPLARRLAARSGSSASRSPRRTRSSPRGTCCFGYTREELSVVAAPVGGARRTSRPRRWATTPRCRRCAGAAGRSTATSASASRR